MDELIRYVWLHGAEAAASPLLVHTLLLLIAAGSVVRSRMLKVRDTEGLLAAAVVLVVALVLLVLSALLSGSPLLGVTGRLAHSPWSHGLFPAICVAVVAASTVFGLVSGSVHSWRDALELLTCGISRWPWAVLLAMTVSFVRTLATL